VPNADLSNVLTDGSHAIFLSDATAGARNFGKITGKANSGTASASVTVSSAFGINLSSKTYAIGGKRASLGSTTSAKLLENNSSTGDLLAGWKVEFQSGHAETFAATQSVRVNGDAVNGCVVVRGTYGAGTIPVITFSNNGDAFAFPVDCARVKFQWFEMRNTHVTKTLSSAFKFGSSVGIRNIILEGIVVSHATDKFYRGVWKSVNITIDSCEIVLCTFKNCADWGLYFDGQGGGATWIRGNKVKGNGAGGLFINESYGLYHVIEDNIFAGNTGVGAHVRYRAKALIARNTFDANTSSGLYFSSFEEQTPERIVIDGNIFSNNGAYGINFYDGSGTDAVLAGYASIRNNDFYNNTSGATNPTITVDTGRQTANPAYTDAANDDYSVSTAVKALGWPTDNVGSTTGTRSYVDPGAAQRQESAGGLTRKWIFGA
jgi:hypothetical protein